MGHELQIRYGQLVDEKLRSELVTKDNVIFSNRYEGTPTSGKVKIPVRDTEAAVGDYDKTNGVTVNKGDTTYIDLDIDKDKYVNELIDGYEAGSVPDGLVAERLDSAGYSLALSIDKDSISALEETEDVHVNATKTASTSSNAYKNIVDAGAYLSRKGVPQKNRWAIVSPEFHALLLQDDKFIRQGDLSQEMVKAGAVGMVAGFAVFVSSNLMFNNDEFVDGKKTTTEFITGHPNWCHRVMEWQVPVHLQDLSGSGKYIGASAVQGRKVYGIRISKPETVYIKRTEV